MKYPLAKKRPTKSLSPLHIADDWKYLEDLEDKATKAYLKAEGKYYDAMMEPYQALKEELYEDLRSRTAEDDASIPEKDGEYWYYLRYEKGQQYPLFCRKKGSLEATEEIYFNQNLVAKDQAYCDVGFVDISPNHKIMAYALDLEGNERYTLRFRDLESNLELPLIIEGLSSCFEWKSNSSFFYILLDDNDRPLDIYFRDFSDTEPTLVYQEKDPSFFLGLDSSESDEYIYFVAHGYDSNEVWFHKISEPKTEFTCFAERRSGHEYDIAHRGDNFLITSNENALNFQIFQTPISDIQRSSWSLLQAHDPEVYIESVTVFRDFWIVSERVRGLPRLKIYTSDDKQDSFYLSMPEEAYEISLTEGREFHSPSFRYAYSTPRIPQTLFEYEVKSRQSVVLKRRATGTKAYSEDDYVVKRVWLKARDGVNVPVTLLYHKDTKAPAPLILHGYGSYGEMLDSEFSNYRILLCERGFIFATAHVRGGSELGKSWYLDGKLQKKKNTFNDYIDVAQGLIDDGYTKKSWIIAEGGSAGGMLMGVVANEAPELFLGIVASVPFVDVLNTMLDDSLPLTTLEYKEWGNPNIPKDYEYIRSYSPYENVRTQNYPHMLVIAGLHDQRVMYWEAAKWVAKLRHMKSDDNLLLLKIEDESGHAGASGRYDSLKELADELCFFMLLKEKITKS